MNSLLHNIEAEQALLGALILDNSLVDNVPDYFSSTNFSNELHAKLYDSIIAIKDKGSTADPITITSYLKSDEQFKKSEGQKYILDLIDSAISLSNIAAYANIVHDLYMRRQIVIVGDEVISDAKEMKDGTSAIEIIESAERRFYNLTNGVGFTGRLFRFKDALSESIKSAEAAYKRDSHVVGVTSGFKALDKWLGGLHRSDLIVVAGRPSMGKTALATNIAFNAAKRRLISGGQDDCGAAVAFFSLEMSAEQLATRILSSESGISSDSIRRGEIPKDSFEKFFKISNELESLELFIDDTPNITVGQIRNRVRRLRRKHNVGLVVVDYLQLIESGLRKTSDNRVNEISDITRSLKGLAKEMDVPVIALSQLSRAVEQRDDKRPHLADLRESGSIEQDSDVVMFVFREEYYKSRKEPQEGTIEHDKWRLEMEKIYNRAELIIAKQRHGPVGTVKLFFDGRLTRFGNLME
jgi:replicative DNA helicase